MKICIFQPGFAGHFLEYLHHIYEAAIKDKENSFYFIVPNTFQEDKAYLSWRECPHIHFIEMTDDETRKCGRTNIFTHSFYVSKVFNRYYKQYGFHHVFFLSLIGVLPMGFFMLPKKVKISGIIYKIFLYYWKQENLFTKIQDYIKYLMFAYSSKFYKIFMLNDTASICVLNRHFKTSKFSYLNDPFIPAFHEKRDMKAHYNLSAKQKLFFHFGSMDTRKGTLDILKALLLLTDQEKEEYCFLFAGKMENELRESFFDLYNRLKDMGVKIILADGFCSYEYIENCCQSCDCILMPYNSLGNSSGVLGHAAYYDKPVLGPNKGILCKLIKKYKLGVTVKIEAASIHSSLKLALAYKVNGGKYRDAISVDRFQETIMQLFQ